MGSFSVPFLTQPLLPVHQLCSETRGVGAASPVCVTSHIRERGGEVDEPGEAADEINAHEGILDGTGAVSTGLDPQALGPGPWALGWGAA